MMSLSALGQESARDGTNCLGRYWPLSGPQRGWRLVDHASRTQHMMTVTHTQVDETSFRMWFSDKPGQPAGKYSIEQFRYCRNAGGDPWLWLDKYIDYDRNKNEWVEHSIQSTKILFTPHGGTTQDLIANGTYKRCGGRGQPYLLFNPRFTQYRIQVWGTVDKDKYPRSNWQWYWDATVYAAEDIRNDCLKPEKTVKAIKVKEAWWENFKGKGAWSGVGRGTVDESGLPTGEKVKPFRTVWHAEGKLPYYVIGTPDEAPNWCTERIWNIEPESKIYSERKPAEQDKSSVRDKPRR
jgi:hypothetical protein